MKQKLLTDHLLGVVVPKEAVNFWLYEGVIFYDIQGKRKWIKTLDISDKYYLDEIGEIIGLSSAITEEQAKGLINKKYIHGSTATGDAVSWLRFWNYDIKIYSCTMAKESLQSLIESSGLTVTPEEDVLLIKVNKK